MDEDTRRTGWPWVLLVVVSLALGTFPQLVRLAHGDGGWGVWSKLVASLLVVAIALRDGTRRSKP